MQVIARYCLDFAFDRIERHVIPFGQSLLPRVLKTLILSELKIIEVSFSPGRGVAPGLVDPKAIDMSNPHKLFSLSLEFLLRQHFLVVILLT